MYCCGEVSRTDARLAWERAADWPRRCCRIQPDSYFRRPSSLTMASVLLRRQLARKIALPRRCLFSSTSSVLAQAAPQSQTTGGKNAYNRHIAEELQGVTASEILAESGTRKDAQMRHFTGEGYGIFWRPIGLTIAPSPPPS
jgi:hypothetical protein